MYHMLVTCASTTQFIISEANAEEFISLWVDLTKKLIAFLSIQANKARRVSEVKWTKEVSTTLILARRDVTIQNFRRFPFLAV